MGSCWGGVYSFKWLARRIKASPESVGLWLKSSKAQNTLIGNTKDSLGPCKSSPIVFETGECSNPCIGLCSSSSKVVEAEKISFPSIPKPNKPGKLPMDHDSPVSRSMIIEKLAESSTTSELSLSELVALTDSDGEAQARSIRHA